MHPMWTKGITTSNCYGRFISGYITNPRSFFTHQFTNMRICGLSTHKHTIAFIDSPYMFSNLLQPRFVHFPNTEFTPETEVFSSVVMESLYSSDLPRRTPLRFSVKSPLSLYGPRHGVVFTRRDWLRPPRRSVPVV
jgi:hypothetical protein